MRAIASARQLEIGWYLVTNLKGTRLRSKPQDAAHDERFETAQLAGSDNEYARFVFLLGAVRTITGPADPGDGQERAVRLTGNWAGGWRCRCPARSEL